MVLNDDESSTDTSLATLLSTLSLSKSPSSCDADNYITESEILSAYQGSFSSALCLRFVMLTRFLDLLGDLETFVSIASVAPARAPRLLAVMFEHAFSAVCPACVSSVIGSLTCPALSPVSEGG